MRERLQKILSSRGVASRRQAEEIIRSGRVSCNGVVCQLGDSADPECDLILLDGKELPSKSPYLYIVLNKPRGYVTTLSDEKGRKNVAQLVTGCNARVYPVGRLDMDSDGLLLFTNDGELANCLMHPRHEIRKTYAVSVTGFSEEALQRFSEPMYLDGYKLSKPDVEVVATNLDNRGEALLYITIHEGRNRQVRRMCAIAGMRVDRLTRIAEGPLLLGDLPIGKWRYLSKSEIAQIKNIHI